MSLFTIQLPVDTPLFTVRTPLSGTDFVLRFDYAGRSDRWYFGLYDANVNPIWIGRKVVVMYDVLRQCALSGRPAGLLFFLGPDAPGFSDLGRSVTLIYADNPTEPET
jgi:hypothetical protein